MVRAPSGNVHPLCSLVVSRLLCCCDRQDVKPRTTPLGPSNQIGDRGPQNRPSCIINQAPGTRHQVEKRRGSILLPQIAPAARDQ